MARIDKFINLSFLPIEVTKASISDPTSGILSLTSLIFKTAGISEPIVKLINSSSILVTLATSLVPLGLALAKVSK